MHEVVVNERRGELEVAEGDAQSQFVAVASEKPLMRNALGKISAPRSITHQHLALVERRKLTLKRRNGDAPAEKSHATGPQLAPNAALYAMTHPTTATGVYGASRNRKKPRSDSATAMTFGTGRGGSVRAQGEGASRERGTHRCAAHEDLAPAEAVDEVPGRDRAEDVDCARGGKGQLEPVRAVGEEGERERGTD